MKEKCYNLYEKITRVRIHVETNRKWICKFSDLLWENLKTQVRGASDEMYEAEDEGDWESAYKNLSDCWVAVQHMKKINDMLEKMPELIYC